MGDNTFTMVSGDEGQSRGGGRPAPGFSWSPPQLFWLTKLHNPSRSITTGHFNGDGQIDLATSGSGGMSIFINTTPPSPISFSLPKLGTLPGGTRSYATAISTAGQVV